MGGKQQNSSEINLVSVMVNVVAVNIDVVLSNLSTNGLIDSCDHTLLWTKLLLSSRF